MKDIAQFLTDEMDLILDLQKSGYLNPNENISDNYISAVSHNYKKTSYDVIVYRFKHIRSRSFFNSILQILTLALAVVRLNVYMAATKLLLLRWVSS